MQTRECLLWMAGILVPFLPGAKGVSRECYCELKEEDSMRRVGESRRGRHGNSYYLRGGEIIIIVANHPYAGSYSLFCETRAGTCWPKGPSSHTIVTVDASLLARCQVSVFGRASTCWWDGWT